MARLTRTTTTETIEPDLAALWRDVVRQGPVARAVMSNLIVFRECGDEERRAPDDLSIARILEDVVARHPCRLIVLDHHPPSDAAAFAVTIGVLTFGPDSARYGIEQIAVRSACAEVQLPSIVRQVVRGDVPTSVWWMDDLSRVPPLDALVKMGRQFLYDSRAWRDVRLGMSAARSLLALGRPLDLADLNWRRLTPVRHALFHARALVLREDLCRGPIRIVYRPGDSALAWLCAGWLASRLLHASEQPVVEADDRGGDAVLTIEFGRDATLRVRLDSHQAVVSIVDQAAPLTVAVPRESDANAIAAELRSLSRDAALHEAIAGATLLLQ